MTISLSKRAMKLVPSATLAMSAKAKALSAEGHDVINFSVGEPDFDTPEHIKKSAKKALDDGFTKYTQTGGIPELKKAIQEKFRRDNNLDYAPDEIIVTCGAKQAIFNALMATIDEGDEVIIPSPYWVSYPEQVMLCGGVPVVAATTEADHFLLNPDALRRLVTPKTKALIICSPSNPTGCCYTAEQIEAIARVVHEKGILLISDEIYEHLVYDGFCHTSPVTAVPAIREQTVLINGVSKAYSMTGWRMGYAAGHKGIIAKMQALQGQQTSNITSFVQPACVEALSGPQECVSEMRTTFQQRRDLMHKHLNAIRGLRCIKPQGAFYLFPNVQAYLGGKGVGRRIDNATALVEYLLETAHVAAVSGDAFGAPGYIRLSYAASEERIEEGMKRMAEQLGKLS